MRAWMSRTTDFMTVVLLWFLAKLAFALHDFDSHDDLYPWDDN